MRLGLLKHQSQNLAVLQAKVLAVKALRVPQIHRAQAQLAQIRQRRLKLHQAVQVERPYMLDIENVLMNLAHLSPLLMLYIENVLMSLAPALRQLLILNM